MDWKCRWKGRGSHFLLRYFSILLDLDFPSSKLSFDSAKMNRLYLWITNPFSAWQTLRFLFVPDFNFLTHPFQHAFHPSDIAAQIMLCMVSEFMPLGELSVEICRRIQKMQPRLWSTMVFGLFSLRPYLTEKPRFNKMRRHSLAQEVALLMIFAQCSMMSLTCMGSLTVRVSYFLSSKYAKSISQVFWD